MALETTYGLRETDNLLWGAIAALGPVFLYGMLFLNLFPLMEFRDWIALPLNWDTLVQCLKHAAIRDQIFEPPGCPELGLGAFVCRIIDSLYESSNTQIPRAR